jgi:hypothetical protein
MSKIEAGELKLSLTDYSMKDVVYNVFSAVEPLATKKKLDFKVNIPPDMPAGHGDERRLTQVVEHVVDQAEQMAAVALDALEHVQRLLRRLAVDAVEDQFGVAEDGVERRAQLVAHVGKELRLVLARLGELVALVLDLVEQPDIFDGDHGLVGEGGDQFDLLMREWLHSTSLQHDDADCLSLTQKRNAQHRSHSDRSCRVLVCKFRIGLHILQLNRFTL